MTTSARRSDNLRTADQVKWAASWIKAQLGNTCDVLTVAGSMRRGARLVHDLEFVAISKSIEVACEDRLFGSRPERALWLKLDELVAAGTVRKALYDDGIDPKTGKPRPKKQRWGDKNRGIELPIEDGPLQIEFYRTTPEHYGLTLAVRTGPRQMSKLLATKLLDHGLRMEKGQVLDAQDRPIPTPTERDLFALVDLPYAEPDRRDELARTTG